MQDSNTSNLIFGIQALVEYVSLATTLEPGDVIATGTPGGVGDSPRPRATCARAMSWTSP